MCTTLTPAIGLFQKKNQTKWGRGFPGVLVLGLKGSEGCTRVTQFCGFSGVKLCFFWNILG